METAIAFVAAAALFSWNSRRCFLWRWSTTSFSGKGVAFGTTRGSGLAATFVGAACFLKPSAALAGFPEASAPGSPLGFAAAAVPFCPGFLTFASLADAERLRFVSLLPLVNTERLSAGSLCLARSFDVGLGPVPQKSCQAAMATALLETLASPTAPGAAWSIVFVSSGLLDDGVTSIAEFLVAVLALAFLRFEEGVG